MNIYLPVSINIHKSFRIDQGKAMLFTTHTFRAGFKNRHHFSKEALASLHTSQVVVQGSPLLVSDEEFSCRKISQLNNIYSQDLFHMTTHNLKASGIFDKLLDDYMDAEPFIPLPKENVNKPLVNVQLMMLWLIWVSGLGAGLLVFIGEVMAEGIIEHLKHVLVHLQLMSEQVKKLTWPIPNQDVTIYPMNEMPKAVAIARLSSREENLDDMVTITELD